VLNNFERKINLPVLNNLATHQKLLLGSLIDSFSDIHQNQIQC